MMAVSTGNILGLNVRFLIAMFTGGERAVYIWTSRPMGTCSPGLESRSWEMGPGTPLGEDWIKGISAAKMVGEAH